MERDTWYCDHPQTCDALEKVLGERAERVVPVFEHAGGHSHHSSLSISDIKKALNVPFIVLSPEGATPWPHNITPGPSFQLTIDERFVKKYKASPEELSHYWIYPDIYCDVLNTLSLRFTDSLYTDCPRANPPRRIPTTLLLSDHTLEPLLNFYNISGKSLVRGSGHEALSFSPHLFKELYDNLESPKPLGLGS